MSSYERMSDMFTDAADRVKAAIEAPFKAAPIDATIHVFKPLLENLATGSGVVSEDQYTRLKGTVHAKLAGCSGQPGVGTTLACDINTALLAKLADGYTCVNDDLEYSVTTTQAHHTGYYGTLRLTTFINWYFEAHFRDGVNDDNLALAAEKYFNKFAFLANDPAAYLRHLCYYPAAGISFKQFYTEWSYQAFFDNMQERLQNPNEQPNIKDGARVYLCPQPIPCKGFNPAYKSKYNLAVSQYEWIYTAYMYQQIHSSFSDVDKLWDENTLMALIGTIYKQAQNIPTALDQVVNMTITYNNTDFPPQDSIKYNTLFVDFDGSYPFELKAAINRISTEEISIKYYDKNYSVADAIQVMTERIALVAIAQAMLACVQLGKLMDHSYILTDAENNAIINPRENIFLYYDDAATQASTPDPVTGLKIPVFREASVNEIDAFKKKYRDVKGVPLPIAVTSEAADAPYYSKAPGLLKTFENKAITGGGAASAQDLNKLKQETKGSSLPLLLGVAAAGLLIYSQNK